MTAWQDSGDSRRERGESDYDKDTETFVCH